MVAFGGGILGELRLAVRRLLATPIFLFFAVLSLGCGVGITTAVYSIIDSLLWASPGVADPDRVAVVTVERERGDRLWRSMVSYDDFEQLKATAARLDSVAASLATAAPIIAARTSVLGGIEAVTGSYFDALGSKVVHGRPLGRDDETRRLPVAVLSYRVWSTAFGANPSAIGETVRIGAGIFTVVGVAEVYVDGLVPRGVSGTAAWIPLTASGLLDVGQRTSNEDRRLTVFGRVNSRENLSSVAAEVGAIGRRLDALTPLGRDGAKPGTAARQWSVSTMPVVTVGARLTRIGLALIGLVALVLVVACTNLANLTLARNAQRRHEWAVRMALGASRWSLVRHLTVESAVIAASGALLAIGVTKIILANAAFELPTPAGVLAFEPLWNRSALWVCFATVLACLFVFGLEPALQATRRMPRDDLSRSDVSVIGVMRPARQRALIRWQVSVSACLFLIAAFLARAVIEEAEHDSGIDLDRVGLVQVDFGIQGADETSSRRIIARLLQDLQTEPLLETAAISSGLPFGVRQTPAARLVMDVERPRIAVGELASVISATPTMFRTLGIEIVTGRAFLESDDASAKPVAVISRRTSDLLFETVDPTGREVAISRGDGRLGLTVIGVAEDTDTVALGSRSGYTLYVPFAQRYQPNVVFVARTSADSGGAARLVEARLREVAPEIPIVASGRARTLLSGPFAFFPMATFIATGLGAITALLALIGLYGVQTQVVARRTRELGIRFALGATSFEVERMVLMEGYRPVVEGIVLGLLLGTMVRLLVRAFFIDIQYADPIAIVLVAVLLLVVAFAACYIPARRAGRLLPSEVLRQL